MISPMYPSKNDPLFGSFVKSYMDNFRILNSSGINDLVCIRGLYKNKISKLFKYLLFYIKTLYYLLFKNYDIIYVQTITSSIPPIKFVSYFKKLPLIFNVHGSDVITHNKKTERLKNTAIPIVQKSKLIVSPSVYFKNIMVDNIKGIDKNRIFVSPSGGVDTLIFSPNTVKFKRDEFVLGYISRIEKEKGLWTFVDTLYALIQSGYNVKGIIVGRGPEEKELIHKITRLSLSEYVNFVGPVAHQNLPNLYRQMSVFVFPTEYIESLGLVGVEALSCGVPVIGSNIGGVTDYIIDGINGFLFEPGNTNELCDKVIKYFNMSEEEKHLMSLSAIEKAKDFDTTLVMRRLYDKICSL